MPDLTVEEVAQELGLHYETVRRFIQNGRIPGYKAGVRQWRVTHDGLAGYKAERANAYADRNKSQQGGM